MRFFVPSDEAERPHVIDKTEPLDRTGWGFVFPRALASQVCSQRENILTVLRDMLLPRLISGEARMRMSRSHLIDCSDEESTP